MTQQINQKDRVVCIWIETFYIEELIRVMIDQLAGLEQVSWNPAQTTLNLRPIQVWITMGICKHQVDLMSSKIMEYNYRTITTFVSLILARKEVLFFHLTTKEIERNKDSYCSIQPIEYW